MATKRNSGVVAQSPDFPGQGEATKRVTDATKGVHSTKTGLEVLKEREAHVLGKRDETEKDFAAHRPKSNVDWHKRVASHRSRRQKDLRAVCA